MAMLTRLVVPILVLGCVDAQQESRGPLAGAPTAVLVDGGLGPGLDAQTRAHRSGFAAGPTLPLPSGSVEPNLLEIMQAVWPPTWPGNPSTLDIDDISLGRDEVLVDEFGIVQVPPSSWGVLSFSLRQGAQGEPGYAIANVAAAGSVGAALFSWVLPGSNLPSQLVGVRAELSHSRRDLGLPVGSEVDAVDFPVMLGREQAGLTALEPGFELLSSFPEEIYFTVSSASVALVPPSWWTPFTAASAGSGATILVVRRQTLTTPWQAPQVWRRWADLGLAQSEDVDALAVDALQEKVLFSVTGTARDQFLFADFGTDGGPPPPLTVATAPGGDISTQVGKIQNDDVDAVCTLDPFIGSSGSPPPGIGDDFGSSCGAPRAGLLGVPSVHGSAFRRRQPGQTFFDTWMVGWPPVTGVTPGIAVLFVTVGDDLTLFPVGPIHVRNIADPVPGNPCTVALPMPPGYSLSGQRLTFRWVAIDIGFTALAEAWPVQVCL